MKLKNVDIIILSVDVGYRLLAKKLGIETNEMVYIGNEEKDIIGANNAGMLSILINRTDKKINYGEKHQFNNLEEMWNFVKVQTFAKK